MINRYELLILLDCLKFAEKEGVLDPDNDYLIEKLEDVIEERIKGEIRI